MAELLAEPRRVRCGLSASSPGRRRGRRRNASRRSLPRRSYRLEVDAGVAAQLMDYPLADDSERLAGEFRIECGDGGGGLATERLELGLSGSPDAPEVVERHQPKPFPLQVVASQVADATELRGTFGDLVGKLCEGRWADAELNRAGFVGGSNS